MPLQNRVNPHGEIITTPDRGTLMGNRGILHNDNKQIVRKYAHKSWVACDPSGGPKQELMKSGGGGGGWGYTQLFFLDEAVAYAAGHRPCWDCQRLKFKAFKDCWFEANCKLHNIATTNVSEIDKVLHGERIERGEKVTFMKYAADLPDGTFIEYEGNSYLAWKNRFLKWSPAGYVSAIILPNNTQVKVLTPRSIVECFRNGLVPCVHNSALAL